MKTKIFTLRDTVAEIYLPTFPMKTEGEAVRAMLNTANNPETQFHTSPEDFVLYEIGTFDDNIGEYSMYVDKKKHGSIEELQSIEKRRKEEKIELK